MQTAGTQDVRAKKKPVGPVGSALPGIFLAAIPHGQKGHVARRAGFTPQQLSDILHGKYTPSLDLCGRLLAAIGKDWAWLDEKGLSPARLHATPLPGAAGPGS